MAESNFVKLSDLIKPQEPTMQLKYIKLFRDAVKEGEIDALPIEKTFTVKAAVYRDLIAPDDKAFQDWHSEALRRLELSKVKGARGISYEADVTSGSVDFKARAEEFRRSLKKRKKRTKRLVPEEADTGALEQKVKTPKAKAAAGAVATGVSSGGQGEADGGAGAGSTTAEE